MKVQATAGLPGAVPTLIAKISFRMSRGDHGAKAAATAILLYGAEKSG